MNIRHLKDCAKFAAGDNSQLREILNPKKEKLKINYSIAWASVKPGEKTLVHKLKFTEVYYILKGTGSMHIANKENSVKENDTIYIPPGAIQFIENIGKKNLEFLCIVDPAWEPECEEIIRNDR